MARHESASSKPDDTTVASIENPTQAQDQDQYGGGRAGASGGGGLPTGMDYQLFEVTNLVVPSGTDWSGEGHSLGTIPFDFFFSALNAYPELVLYKLALHTAAVLNGSDALHLGLVRDIHDAANTTFGDAGVSSAGSYQTESTGWTAPFSTYNGAVPPTGLHHVALFTDGPTTASITVVQARAAFLIL